MILSGIKECNVFEHRYENRRLSGSHNKNSAYSGSLAPGARARGQKNAESSLHDYLDIKLPGV